MIVGFLLLGYCSYIAGMNSDFSFSILTGIGVIAGGVIMAVGMYTVIMNKWPWQN
jgi:hypothetical protein